MATPKKKTTGGYGKPLLWGAGIGVAGLGIWYFFFRKPPSTSTPPPPTTTNIPAPAPTQTTSNLPNFGNWKGVTFPLNKPIGADSPLLTAETAFVIRLVQQRLIDLGYLKITATTGQFLDQTAAALKAYKMATLNLPSTTAGLETIGVTTMNGLFNNDYNIYKATYDKLKAFYASKNETIPAGLSGVGMLQAITIKETDVYDKDGNQTERLTPGFQMGDVLLEKDNWVIFKTANGKQRAVPRWAVQYV